MLQIVTWQERVTWLNVLFSGTNNVVLFGSMSRHVTTKLHYNLKLLTCISFFLWRRHLFLWEAICFFGEAIYTLDSNWYFYWKVCSWSVTYEILSCSNENMFSFQLFKLFIGLICGCNVYKSKIQYACLVHTVFRFYI